MKEFAIRHCDYTSLIKISCSFNTYGTMFWTARMGESKPFKRKMYTGYTNDKDFLLYVYSEIAVDKTRTVDADSLLNCLL